jgi:DNA-binding CsgD family transcriptional regulator
MLESLLQKLVGGPQGVQARAEGIAFLKVAKSLYPIAAVGYLGLNIPFGAQRKRFIHCAYSDARINQCASHDVLAPAVLETIGPALRQPLDWSELPDGPETEAFLQFAGPGEERLRMLSLPLRPIAGEHGLLCATTALMNGEWASQKEMLLRELQVLGNYLHQHILRIYGHDAGKDMLISARELDCLKWMAAGKTAWEASVILGISERTVRFHLNAAREKLDCMTTTQAVAKAVSQQLI